jgi:NifU-like protein involved in Fe-S cluster formation
MAPPDEAKSPFAGGKGGPYIGRRRRIRQFEAFGASPPVIDAIYNERILGLAANIPRLGRLAAPDASAKAHSKLCGSTVVVDIKVADGKIVDFAHDVKACALGQASSSLMASHAIGASLAELEQLRVTMLAMLKAGGPPPEGKWADFAVLEPVKDYRARHASTMLTFEATVDALRQAAVEHAAPA